MFFVEFAAREGIGSHQALCAETRYNSTTLVRISEENSSFDARKVESLRDQTWNFAG